MFRAAIAAGSELGKQVEPILARGKLVPDEITIALIRERLAQPTHADGFVLDGFPRNLAQAEALDETAHARSVAASTRSSSSTCPTRSRRSGCSRARPRRAAPTTRPT